MLSSIKLKRYMWCKLCTSISLATVQTHCEVVLAGNYEAFDSFQSYSRRLQAAEAIVEREFVHRSQFGLEDIDR